MIVEIEKPRPSCGPSLDYNEGKVLQGVAELVAYANMDSVVSKDIYALFQRYENSSFYPIAEKSFHASVNPSEADRCSQAQVLSFIKAMMEHLGYGSQPYLVYRHFDIEREHYHVVSVRVRKDGRKINNYYEKRRVSAFMKEHSREFGFAVAKKGERVRVSPDISEAPQGQALAPRMDLRKGSFAQLKEIYARALSYDFNSLAQLGYILEDLGVKASFAPSGGKTLVRLQGLDRMGNPATGIICEEDLGVPMYAQAMMVIEGSDTSHRLRYREKDRVKSLVGFAFDVSRSEGHFVNILAKKGISVHFSRTEESGDVFGVTFIDHTTMTVFRSSEIRGVFSVSKMNEAVATGKWRAMDRGYSRNSCVKVLRASSQRQAVSQRDIHVSAVAHSLTPVGQPRGASWSGQAGMTEEERKAKREEAKPGALDADLGHNKLQDVLM